MQIKYSFEPDKGKIMDLLAVSNLLVRKTDIQDLVNGLNVTLDPVIQNAYNKMKHEIDISELDFSLLCNPNSDGNSFFLKLAQEQINTINNTSDVISFLEDISQQDFLLKLFAFYDSRKNLKPHFYESLIDNKTLMLEYIEALNIPTEFKWKLSNILQIPNTLQNNFINYLKTVETAINDFYDNKKEYIINYYEIVKARYDENPESLIANNFSNIYDAIIKNNYSNVIYGITFFFPFSTQKVSQNSNRAFIFLGYDYDKCVDAVKQARVDPVLLFKAIGDPVRQKIIHLLMKDEMGPTDMCRALSVYMAPLIHHLNVLEAIGAIAKRKSGKNTYYSLDKTVFLQAIEIIQRYIA